MSELERTAKHVDAPGGGAWVVREEPLVIRVGEHSVLTMRTPGHDVELAVGFLLGEGIVRRVEDVAEVEESGPLGGRAAVVDVRLAKEARLGPVARERLTRAHAIRPSCGLCGLTSADALGEALGEVGAGPRVRMAELVRWSERMREEQPTFAATGGSHAAAVFAADGTLWATREDVGRHNALDKALGRCALDGRPLERGVAILSGRGGYELVLKALRLGVPVVASVSAPSSLAVELAEACGATLVGFLRRGGGRVYVDEGRIQE